MCALLEPFLRDLSRMTGDLMVPGDPHKQSWSNGRVEVHDFHAPLSLVGSIYGHGYLAQLRPFIRNLYFKAAAAMRARLTRLTSASSQ